ncbi:hypothetical protein KP509_26G001600 [Ceratopteris richardii]|uniref:DWD hypersensitive to UV-B 1 N-terminal domain-containing protein n=1 Tax=Ceratopteris richardii TaxID=49495 RepID=A0A8T2RHU0_CERRI|nr:hypothetical protein KP509_26G001600 [Ceratopteris richardii]KAH7295970.1 hypothetical protein KP509_26G001600 [Ceratopteris richardii]
MLISRYLEACEKHGVTPNLDIRNSIFKAQDASLDFVMKLNLEESTEADMMALTDMFAHLGNSDCHAVDIVYNRESTNGQLLLRVLRSIGPKLRLLDLKKAALGRDVIRDLLHRGIQCQCLDLTYSRFRRLDMIGHFPQLHTLILDFSFYITSLPEGCFRSAPYLARISMCETKVANLWTTCASLKKLPSLVELRFQSCKCCEGTGPCRSLLINEKHTLSQQIKHSGINWNTDTTPMHMDDCVSLDSEASFSSNTDSSDYDQFFSDVDSAMLFHPLHSSSEEFLADSEPESDAHYLDTMSVDVQSNYTVDMFDLSNTPTENDTMEDKVISGDVDIDHGSASLLHGAGSCSNDQRVYQPLRRSPDKVHTNPGNSTTRYQRVDFQKEDGFPHSTNMRKSLLLRYGGFLHSAPICSGKFYREFMLVNLPHLSVLDNIPISEEERENAIAVYAEHFEGSANSPHNKKNMLAALKCRETSSPVIDSSSSKVKAGMGLAGISFTRSVCALKMSSCAWPSCVPLCKERDSSSQLSRKYRPRQFEYHPSDPSLMVFGTLHGEVVVLNHESDKIVGQVQSNGSSDSILGLCWLNRDPSKLIAGADNGSLQMYDVDRMRTPNYSALSNSQFGANRLSEGYSRHRSPAVHVYEDFEQLTSVHVNSCDEYFLTSGYSRNVGLYDICTGKQLQVFSDLHQQHINVVKFAHHSPNLFATSSFDKEIKMWDLRQRVRVPIYTVKSLGGNVMVCFSRDDHYLLSSAVDNEVRQHLAVDGRLHMKYDIPPSGSTQNYTRSYYMNGRDYIISGSCEENVVRIYCARTGRHLRDLALEGRGSKASIYVQSLRGDPFRDFHFGVLAAYFHPHPKSEILKINLLSNSIHKKSSGIDSQQKLPAGMGA